MASIPISLLNNNLYITKDDFLAVVDSSSLTTYKSKVEALNNYFNNSGSVFFVFETSSSISTSYSVDANTASYVYPGLYDITSSWAQNVVWGNVVKTASLSYQALTASRLEGIGSSYENIFIVNTVAATTGSGYFTVLSKNNLTSSLTLPAIKEKSVFFNKDYTPGVDGYGKLFFFEDNQTNTGKLVAEIGDVFSIVNGIGPDIETIARTNAGILFQTSEAGNLNGLNRTGSLLFIRPNNGRTYARILEAQEFSSSINTANKARFYGTASYALQVSLSLATAQTFPIGCIVGFASATPSIPTWATCSGNIYNDVSYPDLAALTGKNFGETMSIVTYSWPRKSTVFSHLGTYVITASAGGSGLYRIVWNGTTTYYVNNRTSNYVAITGLLNGNYTYEISDYGFTPSESINLAARIDLNTSDLGSGSTFITGSSNYRYPNLNFNVYSNTGSYFYTPFNITPLTWIIETG